MSRANSSVVRCHGTATPPNASPTTRSAESVGSPRSVTPGVAHPHAQVRPGPQAEPLARELDEVAVDLEHARARARPRGGHVARQREPAAADEHRLERPRGHVVDGVAHPLRVVELEVRRVLEVDVRVAQALEPQHAPALPPRVLLHARAVVDGLGVARRAGRQRGGAHDDRAGAGRAARRRCGRRRGRARRRTTADDDDGDVGRQQRDDHEAGRERAHEAAGGRPRRQAADDGAGRRRGRAAASAPRSASRR